MASQALIQNDGVVVGILALCLGFVFYTSNSPHPFWRGFYRYIPALLICYLLPAIFNSLGVIDGEHSQIYFFTSLTRVKRSSTPVLHE